MIIAEHNLHTDLCERFAALRTDKKLRHRDAARELGITEGEAIAAHVGSHGTLRATRLEGDFPQLIAALSAAGPLMALTRNDAVVHERTGTYLTRTPTRAALAATAWQISASFT